MSSASHAAVAFDCPSPFSTTIGVARESLNEPAPTVTLSGAGMTAIPAAAEARRGKAAAMMAVRVMDKKEGGTCFVPPSRGASTPGSITPWIRACAR
jgi:hypothetical protein